jgi:hypothetical protein
VSLLLPKLLTPVSLPSREGLIVRTSGLEQ